MVSSISRAPNASSPSSWSRKHKHLRTAGERIHINAHYTTLLQVTVVAVCLFSASPTHVRTTVKAFVPSCVGGKKNRANVGVLQPSPQQTILTKQIHNSDRIYNHIFPTSLRFRNEDHNDDTVTTLVDTDQLLNLPDVSTMKTHDMKKELEKYGMSTRSLFDRSDFEYALLEARKIESAKAKAEATTTTAPAKDNAFGEKESADPPSTSHSHTTWQERYDTAVKAATIMKLSKLKEELKIRGVSTKGLFDKDEFVKAYGTAIADNIPIKKHHQTNDNSRNEEKKENKGFWEKFNWNVHSNKSTASQSVEEEPYDPSYRDVTTYRFDPLVELAGDTIIDIALAT